MIVRTYQMMKLLFFHRSTFLALLWQLVHPFASQEKWSAPMLDVRPKRVYMR